jgi:simple sugar transport system ATP-binding protein
MSFGSNEVLSKIDLNLEKGRITALIGANGAGKSTLIKILAGVHQPTAGNILIDGSPVQMNNPITARHMGIETVHQRIDEGVVPGLTVAENLLFERIAQNEIPRVRSLKALLPPARAVADSLSLNWSDSQLKRDIFEIGIADQQLVMLARAVSRRPRLLILDEPTSALSAAESERLFSVVKKLRESGVAILYVSHRLGEIDSIADRVLVIRDGKVTGDQTSPFDWRLALMDMLGSQVVSELETFTEMRGELVVLELDDVKLFAKSESFNLDLKSGEVTGVIGLLGAGKTELAAGIFGAQPFSGGSMKLLGKQFEPKSPKEAVSRGIYLVPEDRAKQSMLPSWSLARVASLPFLNAICAGPVLSRGRETKMGVDLIQDYKIVSQSPDQEIDSLSGGNQQKVVVGRWMQGQPRIMLLDEPFRGVDIGARREITRKVRSLAKEGGAPIVFSADIDEILEIADRIIVLVDGSVRLDRYTTETNRDEIVRRMSEVM